MELVKGVHITDYCDANRLSTEDRLRLFIQVCRAVQHAHQKGVIHRDLKPSNVLVTEQEGRAAPKVIDFGIAKATEQELTEKTFFTRFNQLMGTPAYMSPEQAGLGSLDVDTRSDIYSLGVLLYDLTSTYFECDVPADERDPRRFGYSRDKRSDCVQVIIALVVTPEGLPLAYEMLPGNTADKTTLRDMRFLAVFSGMELREYR